MNCPNCAAPMELFARRRYYFCQHCGTFHFLNSEVDGVQILERPAGARPCPRCGGALARSLLDDAHVVEHCESCRGLLIPRADFADAVARRRARASGPPAAPVPIDQRELAASQVRCPGCRDAMDIHPYYGPGNVVIDTCSGCDLVWLDFGELGQITDAPGRDRGQPAGSPPERGATAMAPPRAGDAWFTTFWD